jgi:hypothetical protein
VRAPKKGPAYHLRLKLHVPVKCPKTEMEDGNGKTDMCGIELKELHWCLLYPCTTCNKITREERICMACKECRDDAGSESDSDGDSDY